MGRLLDTTVYVDLERAVRRLPSTGALAEVSDRLAEQLGRDEEVGIAAITASELLHGVHRATVEHRARREAFVEAVIAAFPPLPLSFWPLARMPVSGLSLPLPGRMSGRTTGSSQPPLLLPDGVSGRPIFGTLTV